MEIRTTSQAGTLVPRISEGRVKGPVLISTLKFLEQHSGKHGIAKVLGHLSQEDQETLKGLLSPSKWYPLGSLIRLMRTSRIQLGQGDPKFYRLCGRASADFAVNVVYKVLFNLASPSFIAQQGSLIYGTFYSEGRLRVVEKGAHHAHAELSELSSPCEEICGRVWGWLERVLELAGAKQVCVEHPECICRGDSVCRFVGNWE